MINRAILMLGHRGISQENLVGMSVLERQILTAAQAGIGEIWIGGHKPDPFPQDSLPQTISIHWISSQNSSSEKCEPPYLALSDQHLIPVDKLREITKNSTQETVSFVDSQGRSVIQAVMRKTEEFLVPQTIKLNSDDAIFLERPLSSPALSKWLRAHSLKQEKSSWTSSLKSFFRKP